MENETDLTQVASTAVLLVPMTAMQSVAEMAEYWGLLWVARKVEQSVDSLAAKTVGCWAEH